MRIPFLILIFILTMTFFLPVLKAEKAVVRLKGPVRETAPAADSVGNFIAVKSGQVKDGEQIPLPTYVDGKQASRSEAHYIVSPAEVPTSLTYVTGSLGRNISSQENFLEQFPENDLPTTQEQLESLRNQLSSTRRGAGGTFYIKCHVDKEGIVHISLWQQSGYGEGTEVVSSASYRTLKESYDRAGITNAEGREDSDNVITAQMKALSDRLMANYMVIAVRSSKK